MEKSAFPLVTRDGLAALELLEVPVYVYDFGTEHIAWSNRAALKFWNAETAEELLNRELTPYSDATRLRLSDYLATFRRGETVTESWTLYPKGVATPTMSRCRGVRLDGGGEAMLVEIQVLTPAELPVNELRAIEALRHTSLMISLFAASGEVLIRNPAAQDLFGKLDNDPPQSAGGDRFGAMFADPADARLLLADAAEQGGTAIRTATMAIEGLPVHAVHLSLVTDPANGEQARLVTQQDMTLLTRLTRQLAASEAALESVLSLDAGAVVVIAQEDAAVLRANFAAQTLFGSSFDQAEKACDLFVDPGQFAAVREGILSGGFGTGQLRLRKASGAVFWASVTGTRITYDRRDALALLVTDIDDLYRTAADLEAALDIERRTTEMQRRFLAITAHDLRTPLAIIDNSAQMIERNTLPGKEEQTRGRAARIRATVQRMLHLLENTLESTRDTLGALGYSPKLASICDVIDPVARTFTDSHPDLELTLNLPQIPPISFDRNLIEQAIGNLIGNAIKYSDGKPRVDISVIPGPESIHVLIRDHGIGIPASERDNIFGEYARAGNVGSRPGTGLGLAIVRHIASLHGGSVDVVDTEGQGTTMRLTLPRP